MRKRIHTAVILTLLIVATRILAHSASLAEIYANVIYKTLVPPLSRVTGAFPFSLAEILIVMLVLWLSIGLVVGLGRRRKQTNTLMSSILNLIIVGGVVYLVFTGLWGLNYYRLEFAEMAGLDTSNATVAELKAVGEDLVKRANHLRAGAEEDDEGVMRLKNRQQVLEQAAAGYDRLAARYPQMGGQYGRAKSLLLSPVISYCGMDGFYFPFTGEANINTSIPDARIPFSACHEMAHQRGIAREGEANFVGYLSCIMNPNRDFQYSGTLLALTYVLNAINGRDKEFFAELKDNLNPGVTRDLQDIQEFGERHRGPWSRMSSRINDIYLKANSQSSGNQSYSGIVELLVAQYRLSGGIISGSDAWIWVLKYK